METVIEKVYPFNFEIEKLLDFKNQLADSSQKLYFLHISAREEAVRYFLDLGDRVGVFDDTGMSAIAVMIEKMPQIALDALDQFQITDYGKRKVNV